MTERTKQLGVRLSDEEHERMLEVAKWSGLEGPSLVRMLLAREYHRMVLEREEEEEG